MSEASSSPATPSPKDKNEGNSKENVIIVRMWPKTPILYPMGICALLFALLSFFFGSHNPVRELAQLQAEPAAASASADGADQAKDGKKEGLSYSEKVEKLKKQIDSGLRVDYLLGGIFLIFFTIVLFTVCVDFEVRWALIAVAFVVILALVLVITNMQYGFLPEYLNKLLQLTPAATPQFYLAVFLIWFALMLVTLAVVRFHYVRIESNEIVVVGGFMEKQKRYSTFRMRFVKEILDVFEYYLPFVRSGRLVFTFPGVEEPLVIDNVLNIDKVIKKLDSLSSRLNVDSANPGEL